MIKFITNTFCLALLLVLMANFSHTAMAGEPIPGIEVILRFSSGKVFNAKTDAEGKFTVEKLPKGAYTVSVRCVDGPCAKKVSPYDLSAGSQSAKRSSAENKNKTSLNFQKIEFKYGIKSPRDIATRKASGRFYDYELKPIVISSSWSATQTFTIDEDGSSYTGHITLMK